jgi:hypothetical protein
VGVINVWFFRQVGDISPVDDSAYFFRVVDTDFTPRLPFFALTQLAGMFKTAGPGWFEETAGPVTRIGAWRDRLDDRASGRGYMTPVNSESAVRLQFVGTQVTVSFFGERDCGRFVARVDRGSEQQFSVPAAGPPQVVVASGLPLTAHTLEIAALDAGSGGCGIDAFQVSAEQPGTPGYVVALLVAAVSAGLLGITGLAVRRS